MCRNNSAAEQFYLFFQFEFFRWEKGCVKKAREVCAEMTQEREEKKRTANQAKIKSCFAKCNYILYALYGVPKNDDIHYSVSVCVCVHFHIFALLLLKEYIIMAGLCNVCYAKLKAFGFWYYAKINKFNKSLHNQRHGFHRKYSVLSHGIRELVRKKAINWMQRIRVSSWLQSALASCSEYNFLNEKQLVTWFKPYKRRSEYFWLSDR